MMIKYLPRFFRFALPEKSKSIDKWHASVIDSEKQAPYLIIFRINHIVRLKAECRMNAGTDIHNLYIKSCDGDRRAEKKLFEVLTSRFRLFAHQKIRNQADAEEVVQDALLAISAEYRSITIRTSFSSWASKVLHNRILNYLRKKTYEKRRFDRGIDKDVEMMTAPNMVILDLKKRLQECLEKLCRRNIRYARILNLHYQGYTTEEICQRLGIKRATLYSALSKARTMLERCLEKGDGE
jgi:RNA polymerase sigma-70 factor (ECF subfamily)